MTRMIAVLDGEDVLIGRVTDPDEATWNAAPARLRFPDGFDNRLKAYKLAEWKPGAWRFEHVSHRIDRSAENTNADVVLSIADLARMISSLARSGGLSDADAHLLGQYTKSFDGIK